PRGVGLAAARRQTLRLGESQTFRSTLGRAELSGNPARVRAPATIPDSKTAVNADIPLAANEFHQFGSVLASLGLNQGNTSVYNARISVQVISGTGRVTAYGSVIDNVSKDPTYVPAQ